MNMKEKIAFFMLLMTASALCFNLGSYERKGESVFSGGKASFEILVWTYDEDNVFLVFRVDEKPGDWNVSIYPERFYMNRTTGSEIVSSGSGYALATLVRIDAFSGNENSYGEIKLVASAVSGEDSIKTGQERVFHLSVPGNRNIENENNETIQSEVEDVIKVSNTSYQKSHLPDGIENSSAEGSEQIIFFIFATAIIILLLCAIKIIREREN